MLVAPVVACEVVISEVVAGLGHSEIVLETLEAIGIGYSPLELRAALRAGVSAYVIAGLMPERLMPVLQVAIARFEQDRALRGQLESAQAQLSERKLIERAKGLLMSQQGLSEEAAYSLLRQKAMNQNVRVSDVAQALLGMADLFPSLHN